MKQESIVIDKKTTLDLKTTSERMTVAGTVILIGAAFAISICLSLFWNSALSPFLQVLVFLVAGIVHTYTIGKGLHTLSATGDWIYTLVVTGIILVLLGSAQFWGPDFPLYLIVSSACAFLFPFSVHDMWKANLQLALEDARVWHPTHEKEAVYPAFYFNNTPMRFRVLQGNGQPRVNLGFKVSNELPLGKIYYDLVQNKTNKTETVIPLINAHQNPYHWVFFTTDSFVLTRPLDPEKTLAENGLHENKIIYVQKVSPADISRLTEQN
ncbi:MAG TPA: TssN family type VI secretion system protein [Flavisolibacter sp.]